MSRCSLVLLLCALAQSAVFAADYYVDASQPDDSGAATTPATAKKTIPAAIGIAANGDTIHVAAGPYAGGITINKSLTFLGAQANVDARTRSVPAAQESVIQASGSQTSVLFDADSIVFNGFTINGDTSGGVNDDLGLEMFPSFSGSKILNNIISNNTIGMYPASNGVTQTVISFNSFQNNNLPGGASGNGIYTDFGLHNALISSNTFTNNSNAGVLITGVQPTNTNSDVTVQNNTITNCGVGVLFVFVTGGTIDGNTLSNNIQGVQIRGGNNGVAITNNSITDSTQWPIICRTRSDVGVDNQNLTIAGNTIGQNASVFVPLFLPGDTRALIDVRNIQGLTTIAQNLVTLTGTLPAAAPRVPGIEVQGNTMGEVSMSFNELRGGNADPAGSATPSAGVRLDADIPTTSTIDIKNFVVSGFAYDVESLVANTVNSIHVNYNNFSSAPSSGTAILNSGSGTLDGLYNWYGQASGPTAQTNPSGTGTAISTTALFNPWLGTGTDTKPLDQSSQAALLASVGFQTPGTPLASLPPVIVSAATAAPNPALVTDTVQFSVAAADTLNRTLTITWNFGDGTSGTGSAVSHIYGAAGTYGTVATITTPDGSSRTSAVSVTVNPVTVGGGGTAPLPFTVKRKTLRASSPSRKTDAIRVQGGFNLPAGTTKLDGTFNVSIGTLNGAFTIDGKGRGIGSGGKLSIRAKRKRGAIQGTAVTFTLTLTGDVGAALTGAGLASGTSGSATLSAQFTYLGAAYALPLTFTVKGGKSGQSGK